MLTGRACGTRFSAPLLTGRSILEEEGHDKGWLHRLVGGELLHIQTFQRVLKTLAEGRRPSALEAAAVVGVSSSLQTVTLSNPEIPDRVEGGCVPTLGPSDLGVLLQPRWSASAPPGVCSPLPLSGDAIPPLAWLLPLLPGSEATFSGTASSPLGALGPLCSLLSNGAAPALPAVS